MAAVQLAALVGILAECGVFGGAIARAETENEAPATQRARRHGALRDMQRMTQRENIAPLTSTIFFVLWTRAHPERPTDRDARRGPDSRRCSKARRVSRAHEIRAYPRASAEAQLFVEIRNGLYPCRATEASDRVESFAFAENAVFDSRAIDAIVFFAAHGVPHRMRLMLSPAFDSFMGAGTGRRNFALLLELFVNQQQ